jgi:multidrug/hemolysin transport system permease protein
VQDKASGISRDFHVSPVKPSALAISYFVSSFITTFIVCLCAVLISLVYLAIVGWYISILDILLVIIDVVILVLFGTALSSVVNFFLSSQGQISAVGTIVSSGYGFVCGAYMPISNFGSVLQTVIKLLPGTYGTSLLRNHTTRGVLAEMQKQGIPDEVINSFRDIMDSRIYFGETQVDKIWMYVILIGTITVLGGVYVLLNRLKNKN